jgi:uncharacterized protein YeaO (DUF488 family)
MDVWLPTLAPSKRLLAWAKKSNLPDREWWQTYLRRYRNEMKLTAACQTIATLALLARKTPISIGCYCDTDYCHRFELVRLIKQAASRR